MQVYAPFVQFRTNQIIRYYLPQLPKFKELQSESEQEYYRSLAMSDIQSLAYSGKVSVGVQKRIRKAVSLLVQGSKERKIYNPVTAKYQKFKLSFITLTISATSRNLTAKEAHNLLLEPFLLHARRKWGVRSYVWKAELQKRGQIHYHITTPTFINHSELRNVWNNLQRKAGLLNDYFSKKGHYDANSTDIHSVYKIKNLEAYLVKYLSKAEEDKGTTDGKVWDCSKNLKKCNYFTSIECSNVSKQLAELLQKNEHEVIKSDYCEIIQFKDSNISDYLVGELRLQYDEFIASLDIV